MAAELAPQCVATVILLHHFLEIAASTTHIIAITFKNKYESRILLL